MDLGSQIRTYALAHLIPKGANGQPDRAVIDGALPSMQRQIDVLDQAVARTGYLAGDAFSLADINLSTMPRPHTAEETAAVRQNAAAKADAQSREVPLQNVR